MTVRKFEREKDIDLWNKFIAQGKNQTFLFNREFMDYHSDRFSDYSLMIFDDDSLIGLLPANIGREKKNILISHEGLTYGGLIVMPDVKMETVLSCFHALLKFLFNNGIENLQLKIFPSFYNSCPTDEIEYIMFLLNAELYRRDVAFVIDLKNRINYSGNIRREGIKAEKAGVIIKEDETSTSFWEHVLVPNLKERFGVSPVHSVEEIGLLKSRFPDNIRQFNAYLNNEIVAGTTLFIDNGVVHCQYISASVEGRKTGALNFLFKHLIDSVFAGCRYFDFGIVNEDNGRSFNKGMLFWKESFGGRAIKHDFFTVSTESYRLLEKYIE